jgi:rhomboid-like protein
MRNGYYKRNPYKAIIWGIIGINGGVFLAWQYAIEQAKLFHDSSSLKFMNRHFTLGNHSFDNLHTFFTCHFSHNSLMHFGINMFVFHSFGSTVTSNLIKLIQVLGASRFIALYTISGLTSGFASMAYKLKTQSPYFPAPASLGASGCVSGLTAVFAWMFPTAEVTLLFFPVPAWFAIGGFLTFDFYKAVKGSQGRVDCAGHIGGGLGGLLWYFMF